MTSADLKSYQAATARRCAAVSRLRHRLDAVALIGRRGAVGGIEHPRRFSDGRDEAGLGGLAASDDRGDEARLCRSRPLSRRPRFYQRADGDPDLQGLRGEAARRHRSRPRNALDQWCRRCRRRKAATPPIIRSWKLARQCGRQHLYAEFQLGVGLVADGTGVLLNNELDDFTAAPGASNAFGLVGFEAEFPGPGKRPLSSMSPTIVLKDGKPVLVTGSPGGSRIISTVLQVIVNVLDYHMDIADAVGGAAPAPSMAAGRSAGRAGCTEDVLAALKAKGQPRDGNRWAISSANSILVTPKGLYGAPDPRTRAQRRRR